MADCQCRCRGYARNEYRGLQDTDNADRYVVKNDISVGHHLFDKDSVGSPFDKATMINALLGYGEADAQNEKQIIPLAPYIYLKYRHHRIAYNQIHSGGNYRQPCKEFAHLVFVCSFLMDSPSFLYRLFEAFLLGTFVDFDVDFPLPMILFF